MHINIVVMDIFVVGYVILVVIIAAKVVVVVVKGTIHGEC